MLILSVSSTAHDSTACLFDEYRPPADVSQERLSRRKAAGGGFDFVATGRCVYHRAA